MADNDLTPDKLLHDFFKWYVKMVADKGFHVDGWEEVWEYEDPEKPGLWKIYDPSVWNVDLEKTKLTGYHWNNMWEEDDGPTTGYMMANAGYNVSKNIKSPGFSKNPQNLCKIPEIRDFFGIFYFRDIPGIKNPGSGFFRGMGYSDKNPTLTKITRVKNTDFAIFRIFGILR